jgi:mono/diheme cytochrome c family protein
MLRWTPALPPLLLAGAALAAAPAPAAGAAAEGAAARGQRALLGRSYNPPTMLPQAYDNAWRHWGLDRKPAAADYDRLFRARYGLHPAPYPNNGLPMGLRLAEASFGLGKRKGLTVDCLVCHGGSIAGQSYVGLGNASLDYQAFYEEMSGPPGRRVRPPFQFSNVRGTSEAGGMAVFLLGYREPDLGLRVRRLELGLHDDLCEDVPAWWLLKKKKTMYHTGGTDTRSVRSLMQFMMGPLNFPADIHRAEADFQDIRAFLLSLEPPKCPLPVDRHLAAKGERLFKAHCARCHGTYGANWTYPNRVVPIDEIGTDRRRYDGITGKFGEYYNKSWFADYKVRATAGYQAPPLDGIWATAPYFHNGSAPTVYHVLHSKSRPKLFTRSYRTDLDAYDPVRLGWKVTLLDKAPDPKTTAPIELRKVYDTSRPGRGNGGHTFGDKLTEAERMAVIEYLKTL